MEPYRTVEARWFRPGEIPGEVDAWFDALGPAVQTEARTDRYLDPASDALGVKLRQGSVEAKRRTAVLGAISAGTIRARVEAWAKWSFPLAVPGDAPVAGWAEVAKRRRQRYASGCALELSRLTIRGEAWWSVCLEAAGPDAASALTLMARRWLGADGAPSLAEADAMGYPAWLLAREASP